METHEGWWPERYDGSLELDCMFLWHQSKPPSWDEWAQEWVYARRQWSARQRQQVEAASLDKKLPVEILDVVR